MKGAGKRADRLDKSELLDKVREKLAWIASLSKETYPGEWPSDEEGFRKLLNRMVQDVRAACALLEVLSDRSDPSDKSDQKLIPTHGGYRNLRSFQVAEIVYDGTVIFCDRFVNKRSRTHDQMVQAARSGRQNIAEGSMASATSKKMELKLTNVAKASLEELLLDFEDFLRQKRMPKWNKDSPEAVAVRGRFREFPAEWFRGSDLSDSSDKSDRKERLDPYSIADASPEVAANTLLCLIHQATYLLNRQVKKLETDFLNEGGFTERLYRSRVQRRRGE